MKKQKFMVVWAFLICLIITNVASGVSGTQESSNKNYRALLLVGNSYGDNYYDLVGNFTEWGWDVETAGISTSVRGCSNHHQAYNLECNLTFTDLDENTLKQYDCLIIPSGGHWHNLVPLSTVETIVNTAHENNLIIGTLCIGQKILSSTEGLMNGVRVAYYSYTYLDMVRENAAIVHEDVVSDQGIVTGGGGGSLNGGGHIVAPTVEVCEAVKIAIQERNKALTATIILYSGGGVVLLSIGLVVIKFRHNIFSKTQKKTQEV